MIGKIKKDIFTVFKKAFKRPSYRGLLFLFGIFTMFVIFIRYIFDKRLTGYKNERKIIKKQLEESGFASDLKRDIEIELNKKYKFFNKKVSDKAFNKNLNKELNKRMNEEISRTISVKDVSFIDSFEKLLDNNLFFICSIILSFPMYILILIYSQPYVKYVVERLAMMIFVIFGVTWLVFTILYISPMNPALNILGVTATPEQVEKFNAINGLDKPYLVQLFTTFKNLITFNMGNSYVGNEDVVAAILRKFPVTLKLTFASLLVAVIIAIPAGIVSAIKQYSILDHFLMLIALIGLSIPNFWLGLILILNFSIRNNILPATFVVGDLRSFIMPSIVLGTSLSATVARMTRSSMLEIKNMDYIVTARAKGLSDIKVIFSHILSNALIPIVTVIGLQFGGMLGGAAVTEKVFNINGIGSYIVDKQFIPDIPIVLAGVVYVAVIISVANLIVDIVYSFLDPRIKESMKSY